MNTNAFENIDEYIASFPHHLQTRLVKMRELIRTEAPDAVATIKYRMPTFVLGENLVHFAAFKNHIRFYPRSSGITRANGMVNLRFPSVLNQTYRIEFIGSLTDTNWALRAELKGNGAEVQFQAPCRHQDSTE